ncbi:MAG: hypothetical protein AB8B96_08795 [Lysobacterales bacterium]
MISFNHIGVRLVTVGFVLALCAPLAIGQMAPAEAAPGQADADAQSTPPPVCAEAPAEDTATIPDEATSATESEDCVAGAPEDGLGENTDPDEMRASMRRFVPSEQISEDSSVAFPNDI